MLLTLLLACAGGGPSSPAPDDATPECGEGELFDGEICVPEACGMAPWGDVEGTVYVDASAAAGGDGSPDAPLSDLPTAVAASTETDIIVLAAGTYPVNLAVEKRSLDLRGRCTELVVLDGSVVSPKKPTLSFNDERPGRQDLLRLQGLTVSGGGVGVFTGGGEVDLDDIVVQQGQGYNLAITNSDGQLDDVRLLDVQTSGGVNDDAGWGLFVAGNSTVEARRLYLRGGVERGIQVYDRADLLLEDSTLDAFNPDGQHGTVMQVSYASATLHDVALTDSTGWGIEVYDGTLDFEGVAITGQRGLGRSAFYPALGAYDGAVITGSGLRIEDSAGGVMSGTGSTIELQQVAMMDSDRDSVGAGLWAWGGRLVVEDVETERTHGTSFASVFGGELVVRRGLVAGVDPGGIEVDGTVLESAGTGLTLVDESTAELTDVVLSGIEGAGILLHGQESGTSRLTLVDVEIADIETHWQTRGAAGIYAQQGTVSADGLVVRDIAGPGLVLQGTDDGAATSLSCTDCDISGVRQAGVIAVGQAPGTQVAIDGCSIQDVAVDDGSGLSIGMLFTETSQPPTVTVRDCEVSGTAHGALFVVGNGAVDVQDSTLHAGSGATYGGLQVHGNAVYATGGIGPWDGATGLRLTGNQLVPGSGDTVLLHDASATLQDNDWGGTDGVLRQQHCDEALPVEGGDEAPRFDDCPGWDHLVLEIDTMPTDTPPVEL
ncbi:MAG: right-handed parallel beta-helix repeat-containing protein [Alphaproteobacteria bacterium]|nr:right-handed parallel beta-helix repeat-containing protein [Alphaproteobacteria bacterium]